MALANAYYKKAAEMYRERNMEYMATAAEKSIVPCDIEVEPFIRRTLSDENKKAENKETANSESIEKPADCEAADKPLADNEENDLDKILSDENEELLKSLNDEFLDELEKEKISRMLKAYEKEKIHIGTFLKKNADKPDEGYDVILLDFTDSEQRKKMETFFLSNYLNITFDEGKRLVNNMPCVISSGLSIAKAIDTYFRLSEIQFVLAIARDNIIFDLDRVSLVESVEYKNDINTDDVVELLKSLAPNSYRA